MYNYFFVTYQYKVYDKVVTNNVHFQCIGFFNIENLKRNTEPIDLKQNEEYKDFVILFFYKFNELEFFQFTK